MSYLLLQILLCLMAAAILGLVIGWLSGGAFWRRRIDEIESSWSRLRGEQDGKISDLTSHLKSAKTKVGELESSWGQLRSDHGDKISQLTGQLAKATAKVGEIESGVGSFATKSKVSELEGGWSTWSSKIEDHLNSLKAQSEQAKSGLESQGRQIGSLEGKLEGITETWPPAQDEQDARLSKLESSIAGLKGLDKKVEDWRRKQDDGLQSVGASLDREVDSLGRLGGRVDALERKVKELGLRAAPPAKDDLKQIHGIGPVIERILNEHGISSFRQIANWGATEVKRVAGFLDAFPERIHRDGWIEGARKQHLKKYGESI